MTSNVVPMKGAREAPKADRSHMETLLLTPELVEGWRLPPFQRPLKVNKKVRAIAEELLHNGGIIQGVMSIGQIGGDKVFYLYDGQHRREAAIISGLKEFIADVRICTFDTMSEMSREFVKLNSCIARMGPDDILRGLESSSPQLTKIRKECPYVGYSNIRRNPEAPTLSMSAALRCWVGSSGETPSLTISGKGVADLSEEITDGETEAMVRFLQAARTAWGADLENARLWSNLNLCMTMWLWRQLVLSPKRGLKRSVSLSTEQFRRCLMSVSASTDYIDWLLARKMQERDRTPCLNRLKAIFTSRLKADGFDKPSLPQPSWAAK